MKRIVSVIVLTSVLMVLFAGCQAPVATYKGTGERITEIKLRIVTMEGEILFDDKVKVVDDNPTVYMALTAAAENKELTLEIKDENVPAKMFLNAINDLEGKYPNFWMYYINTKMAEFGIGTQALNANDVVEFIFGDYKRGYVEIK